MMDEKTRKYTKRRILRGEVFADTKVKFALQVKFKA